MLADNKTESNVLHLRTPLTSSKEDENLGHNPRHGTHSLSELDAENAARLLSDMGNAKRLEVLIHLSAEEISVNELASLVGLSQSALSQHLSRLRAGGLVSTRRDGLNIYYSCTATPVKILLEALDEVFGDK